MCLTVSSFFHYYMFHPEMLRKSWDRDLARISSIALGVITLGMTHLICYAALYRKNFSAKKLTREQVKNASETAQKGIALKLTIKNIGRIEMVRGISPPPSPRFSEKAEVPTAETEKATTLPVKEPKSQLKKKHSRHLPKTNQGEAPYEEPKFVKYGTNSEVKLVRVKQWAEEGILEYQLFLGKIYLFGKDGVRKSKKQAFHWYTLASQQNNPLAQYRLGKMYLKGYGVKRSLSKGLELLNKSQEQGFEKAKRYLERHKLTEEPHVRFA